MRAAASTSLMALLIAVPLAGTGCGVQQDRYDSLIETERTLKEQNIQLTDERNAAQSQAEIARSQLADARNQVRTLEQENTKLRTDVDELAKDYEGLMDQVSTLDISPLPLDLRNDLQQLADSSESLTFDERRGLLQFSSDLTFALGSTELQTEAMTTLTALAAILNGPSAASLEVHVVGHTDNVPIGKPETRQKHPTNMHLSVHRAIAVQEALVGQSVDPIRIQVAGYGQNRPFVANGPKGAKANRRVEIFLTRMPPEIAQRIPAYQPESAQEAQATPPDPMK
ncbi:MAG: OmpA family protein [Planctomycetota bacterium]|jgi:flagellar motor protein MotB